MKKKILIIPTCAFLFLSAISGIVLARKANIASINKTEAITQDGEGYYLVTNATDFNAVFNGAADYTTKKVKLTADIDLDGAEYQGRRMAGEFTGDFDGQGFTVSNFSLKADSSLFNIVGASGKVRNVNFVWTALGNQSALAYNSNGLFDNCSSTLTTTSGCYTVWGASAYAFAPGSGTFRETVSRFVLDAENASNDAGTYPAALIGNNGAHSGTIEDCFYDISGTYAASGKIRAQSTTAVSDVTAVNITETSTDVEPSATTTVELVLTGNQFDTLVWSSDDDSVATVVGGRHGATITGVAGGDTKIRATVTVGGNNYSDYVDVHVEAAATDISSIEFEQSNIELKEGETIDLSVNVLAGTQYNSFEYTVANDSVASYEYVSDKEIRIAGLAVGSTTITATCHTDSGDVEATCTVTVEEAIYLPVYFAIKDSFTNLGSTGYSIWVYGGNDTQMAFPLNDTTYDVKLGDDTCSLYLAQVNLNVANKLKNNNTIMDGVFMQLCGRTNTGARWGAGFALTSMNGHYATAASWTDGAPSPTSLGSAVDVDKVLDFCIDYMKAETISLDNESETADCVANYTAAIGEVTNLTANQRVIFSTTAYYARLQAWATANSSSFSIDGEGNVGASNLVAISATSPNNNVLLIIAASSILAITICGLIAFRRKRLEK